MDDVDLPRPVYWRDGNRRLIAFGLLCLFGYLLTLIYAAAAPAVGIPVLLGFTALVLAALQFGEARKVVVRTETVELAGERVPATVFPLRRTGVRIGWLALAVPGGVGAWLLVHGVEPVGLALLGVALAGALVWYLLHRDRDGNPPSIALCEQGIVLVRSRTELVPWAEVAFVGSSRRELFSDVVASATARDVIVVWDARRPGPIEADRNLVRTVLDDLGGSGPYIRTTTLRCDPVIVYHALRFYTDREGTRPELGTVAASQPDQGR